MNSSFCPGNCPGKRKPQSHLGELCGKNAAILDIAYVFEKEADNVEWAAFRMNKHCSANK